MMTSMIRSALSLLGLLAAADIVVAAARVEQPPRSVQRHVPKPAPVLSDYYRPLFADRGRDYSRAYRDRYVVPGSARRCPRTKRVSGLSARNQTRPAGHVKATR